MSRQDVAPGAGSQAGLGDTVQSLFLSPRAPTAEGLIWGAGPVFLLPTATDELLGSRQWGLGPTGVALVQRGPWSYGALANHLWKVAGDDSRPKINATFLQPFVSYTTPQAWTFVLQSESTYDWTQRQWLVPIGVSAGKVTKIGDQLINLAGGVRYWADSPDAGPSGWGLRLVVTLLFPK